MKMLSRGTFGSGLDRRPSPRCLGGAVAAAVALQAAGAAAQQVTSLAGGGISYDWSGSAAVTGSSHVVAGSGDLVTSNPSTFGGPDLAPLIGATTFYANGYTGAGTIASNVEAGHVWSGHESIGHVTQRANEPGVPGGPYAAPAFDRHATWVAMMIGGRVPGDPDPVTRGIAFDTDLRSGAMAANWNGSAYALGFSTTVSALVFPYASAATGFGTADVVNSSWGADSPSGSAEAGGSDIRSLLIDGIANQNPRTTFVASAGNGGGTLNPMVGAPGSGYNGITVGALQNVGNVYDTVAGFSSRGPNDYRDPTQSVLANVARRAAVDVVAPGTTLTGAFYGGQTGGNDSSLSGSSASGTPTSYSGGLNGTSFAAPVTAGAVALMHQAAVGEALPADAEDTRVIKASLMNAARKIPGWSNGQTPHPNGNGGVRTTDALDMTSGAGAIDLTRTWDQFTQGQTDIPGLVGGITTETVGWDFGSVNLGANNDVLITTPMTGEFRVTLSWFRERTTDTTTFVTNDIGFANLNLQVWDATFTSLVSESLSTYGESEHLVFTLPSDGPYGLRVAYPSNVFGSLTSEEYGLAWYGTAVPEPGTVAAAMLGAGLLALRRRRHR